MKNTNAQTTEEKLRYIGTNHHIKNNVHSTH